VDLYASRAAEVGGTASPILMTFSILDWLILGVYLVGMTAIGVYFSPRQTSTREFFLGGQRFGYLAMSLSVLATGLSAITFIGQPGFAVERDWSTLMAGLVAVPATIIAALLFVPFFWRLRLTSAYEYLEKRFDFRVSMLCSVLFLMLRGLLAGIAIYAPSIALSAVTGWNITGCIVISGALTVLYSSLGGMSAVVWTDVVQAIVLFGGAIFAAFHLASQLPGGPAEWIARASAEHKFNAFDFELSWTRLTFWGACVGGLFYSLAFYGVDQVLVQRYLSSSSLKKAQKSLFLNALYLVPVNLLFLVIGTLLYLFLTNHRDSFPRGLSSDQIFPYYIVRFMPAGLPGLMVAAIYAAAMSTLSSVLNSLTTVSINDFYKRWRPRETEAHYVRLSRRGTVVWGTLAIFTALLAVKLHHSVLLAAIKGASLFMGPMLGTFLLGMISSKTTALSALIGCIIGILTAFAAGFGTPLELFWLTLLGTVATMATGFLISILCPAKLDEVTKAEAFSLCNRKRGVRPVTLQAES
jgi:solute:Na+ symporter, SSS family